SAFTGVQPPEPVRNSELHLDDPRYAHHSLGRPGAGGGPDRSSDAELSGHLYFYIAGNLSTDSARSAEWDDAQIRVAGGGPSEFSISGGNPLASLTEAGAGLFLQDDWKLRANLTVSGGLRYEFQTNSRDHSNLAPRIGFALVPGKAIKAPKFV